MFKDIDEFKSRTTSKLKSAQENVTKAGMMNNYLNNLINTAISDINGINTIDDLLGIRVRLLEILKELDKLEKFILKGREENEG